MGSARLKRTFRVLVTGGAGFIGSHLVDQLMRTVGFVRVVDNLGNGSLDNVKFWLDNQQFQLIIGDLKDPNFATKCTKGVEIVFHLAANPEVRVAEIDPSVHFNENLLTTFNVLEAMRKSETARLIVFFSSSTVYGEPEKFPTVENYSPLQPISVYGASKLGCESLISAYCHTFGLRGLIFRLANVVGSRSTHGVVVDFIRKLQKNSKEIEILGDGNQRKSYLHIKDCVGAVVHALRHFLNEKNDLDIYNVGSLDQIDVKRIAEVVAEEMGLQNLNFKFTGGVNGGRGWKGDVMTMLLSSDKLMNLGWGPKFNSEEAVRLSCEELLRSMDKAQALLKRLDVKGQRAEGAFVSFKARA